MRGRVLYILHKERLSIRFFPLRMVRKKPDRKLRSPQRIGVEPTTLSDSIKRAAIFYGIRIARNQLVKQPFAGLYFV
jgi:hypothetical protein